MNPSDLIQPDPNPNATMHDAFVPWIWRTTKGHEVKVEPTYAHRLDRGEWFAEQPGQRPPQDYALKNLTTGEAVTVTVFPVEPWSALDAITDKLNRWGWEDTTAVDPGLCEHGLSAALCAGPGHYPMDY